MLLLLSVAPERFPCWIWIPFCWVIKSKWRQQKDLTSHHIGMVSVRSSPPGVINACWAAGEQVSRWVMRGSLMRREALVQRPLPLGGVMYHRLPPPPAVHHCSTQEGASWHCIQRRGEGIICYLYSIYTKTLWRNSTGRFSSSSSSSSSITRLHTVRYAAVQLHCLILGLNNRRFFTLLLFFSTLI